MVIIDCKICDKKFYAKPCHIKRGDGKYCSNSCSAQGRRTGKFVVCAICGKNVWRTPRYIHQSKSGKYFCNKSCQALWRNSIMYIGPNHPNWKGGDNAYRDMMLRATSVKACKRCGVADFRLLTVHHLDENRHHNTIENLVWMCYNCHFLVHKDKEEKSKFMEALV